MDYIGVFIGPDLMVRDGQIRPLLKNWIGMTRRFVDTRSAWNPTPMRCWRRFDVIIKNTWRTLMTRGMKGCFVYSVDAGTAAYSRASIRLPVREEVRDGGVAPSRICGDVSALLGRADPLATTHSTEPMLCVRSPPSTAPFPQQ